MAVVAAAAIVFIVAVAVVMLLVRRCFYSPDPSDEHSGDRLTATIGSNDIFAPEYVLYENDFGQTATGAAPRSATESSTAGFQSQAFSNAKAQGRERLRSSNH